MRCQQDSPVTHRLKELGVRIVIVTLQVGLRRVPSLGYELSVVYSCNIVNATFRS